ncbi:21610_t:CDS:1, partial [Cetraspora pellucida]
GNKRGPKSAADTYQSTFMNNSSFIHDEHTSNNDQNITSSLNFSPNSFSANDSLSHLYSHTTEVTQPSLYFHDYDQNIPSFTTNDLNGSFYHETSHPHIDPLDEATESSQNC